MNLKQLEARNDNFKLFYVGNQCDIIIKSQVIIKNMQKIVIDKNKCIGCFNCKHVCYEVFDIGEDGKAKVRYEAENNIEEAQTAIINCPTGAIKIIYESNTSLLKLLLNLLCKSNNDE